MNEHEPTPTPATTPALTQSPAPEPDPVTSQAGGGVPGAAIAALCLLMVALSGYLLWTKATARSNAGTAAGLFSAGASGTTSAGDGSAASSTSDAPRLMADRNRIDLGDIQLGKTVQVDFRLTNAGGQPLKILEQPYVEVVQGCCPPQPAVGATSLAPGQATDLSMQFMMHEGMGGPHLFRVHVKTNDPNQPDRTLDVTSNWVG